MQNDYPAAHSMDTEWFAIDKDGFVALMTSEETGPVPIEVYQHLDQGEGYELVEKIANALKRPLKEDQWGAPDAPSIGLYHFTHQGFLEEELEDEDEEAMVPYSRPKEQLPQSPVHITQLPEDIAKMIVPFKFDVAFADTVRLQPLSSFPCEVWGEYETFLDASLKSQPMPPPPGRLPPLPQSKNDTEGKAKSWWDKLLGK